MKRNFIKVTDVDWLDERCIHVHRVRPENSMNVISKNFINYSAGCWRVEYAEWEQECDVVSKNFHFVMYYDLAKIKSFFT